MTIAAQGVLKPLLMTLFGAIDGDIRLSAGQNEIEAIDSEAVSEFILKHGETETVTLELATSANEAAVWAALPKDADEAEALLDQYGDPLLALEHPDHGFALLFPFDAPMGDAAEFFAAADQNESIEFGYIPVPGTGGWNLTGASLATLQEPASGDLAPEATDAPAEAEEPASEPLVDASAPFFINDAEFIRGEPDEAVLNHPLKIAVGANRQEKRWIPKQMRWMDLIGMMSKHVPSADKDGRAFIQGTAIGNQRTAKAMEQMSVVGLDADTGAPIQKYIDYVQDELHLAAIFYTTHSNEKTDSKILESSFMNWAKKNGEDARPTPASMRRYLLEAKHWEKAIVDSVELSEQMAHDSDGIKYVVTHDPMPKYRILFPLQRPYVVAKQNLPQIDAINRWKGKILGLAKIMKDLPIDESCLDPSRLFYLPRHPEGMPFRTVVTNGNLLDFDAVPEVDTRARAERVDDDLFSRAATELGAGVGTLMVGDFSLRAWATQVGPTFQIAELIREAQPGRIRGDNNTDKIELECPFDSEHSNAGDPEDRACFAVNAHGDGGEKPFHIGCQHNTCKSRSRLEFVQKMLEDGWIEVEHLTDDRYRVFTVEEQEEFIDPVQVMREAMELVADLPTGIDGLDQAEKLIADCLKKGASKSHISMLLDAITKKGIGKKKEMAEFAKDYQKEVRKTAPTKDDDKIREELKRQGITVPADCKIKLLTPLFGHGQQKDEICTIITQKNTKDTRLFDYGGDKVHCEMVERYSDIRMASIDRDQLAVYLAPHLAFYRVNKEGELTSVSFDDKVLREVTKSYNWYCPQLNGFASLPYYDEKGSLVTKPGFNPVSKLFLKPAVDISGLRVPPRPTAAEMASSKAFLLDHIYGEFPFDDGTEGIEGGPGSRAHLLAMILHPFVRQMVKGPTPIYLVSKPTPGTGATFLVESALMINSGRDKVESQTEARTEEEQKKVITSQFRSGRTFFWIDNVHAELRSAAYCNLATASVWEDRTLGKSEMVSYPNILQFIIAGNNPRGTGEIMRRCLPIRLDVKGDPLARTDFKINPFIDYVCEHRIELIGHVLTLVNGWVAAGMPKFSGKPLTSFESYCSIVGGILENAGVPGFLTNLDLTTNIADEETRSWESLVQQWANVHDIGEESTGLSAVDVAKMMILMDDYPNIGVRYPTSNDEEAAAKTIATRVREKLDIKAQSPHKITSKEGKNILVGIFRFKNPANRQTVYKLMPM